MSDIPNIFERQSEFDPAGDFDAFLHCAPAKWVVYLMSDGEDRPVQLLCVKNLRASLKRRLGGLEPAAGLSRRVDYRDLVRRVRWRRVDSAFEADWIYYEAARRVFPDSYRGMVGFRPAWFVHVDPEARFPRYVKTIDLSRRDGILIGPMEDKHAAARFIELTEDAFDLCRMYNLLTEAPRASACAYKEMGKCPAPCDGSISMDQYRRLIELSVASAVDPAEAVRQQTRRMEQAAAELRFETAGKIKAYTDQLSKFGKGPFRHAGLLREFTYLSFQPGPHPQRGEAKVFLITPGQIQEILGVIGEEARPAEVLRVTLTLAEESNRTIAVDEVGAERIGIVAHHLFAPKQSQGVFLPLNRIDEKQIVKACRDLRKLGRSAAQDQDDEGVMKELQAI